MSLRLRQPEPEPRPPSHGSDERRAPSASGGSPMPQDEIDRWLATFSALARLPEARRAAVADELEDHLRCRTRDLMLRGASEPEAIRKSIAELGEAAELAARFRLAARTPIWRHVMTFSILGISAAALTLSVIAIAGGPQQEGGAGQPTGVVFRNAAPEATSDSLNDVRVQLDLQEATIAEFIEQAGKAAKTPVFVHWDNLPVDPEEKITLQVGEVSFPTALRLLNTRIDYADGGIDFRQRDGLLEFASRNYFDQQEAQLVRYDLAPVLGHTKSHPTAEEVAELIYAFVSSESWEANGGRTASLRIAGEQMFINAPARMLPKIEWILAQFAKEAEAAEAEDARAPEAEGDAISVRVIPLREADAASLGASLAQVLADLPGVKVTTDARTNVLLISATADWHERIDALLPLLDRPAVSLNPDAAAAATAASAEKLRAIAVLVHNAASRLGRWPQQPEEVLGLVASIDNFTAPDGQRYWLDIPAMETMNSRRIVGYDRGAVARGEYIATLFADGHVEVLAPLRLRDLMDDAPNLGVDFDLPDQQVGAAPGAGRDRAPRC